MSSVSKIFKVTRLILQIFINFVKMLCNMIEACIKNFSLIGNVFLKLQYFKVFDSFHESWQLVIRLHFYRCISPISKIAES